MSTSPQVPVSPKPKPMQNHPSKVDEYLRVGQKCRVLRCNSDSSMKIGSIVEIDNVMLPNVHSVYAYAGRNLDATSRRANFLHSELEPCITIKAYAYHHKSTNEFHWFSSEKDRKGYTRFISHDIESYK